MREGRESIQRNRSYALALDHSVTGSIKAPILFEPFSHLSQYSRHHCCSACVSFLQSPSLQSPALSARSAAANFEFDSSTVLTGTVFLDSHGIPVNQNTRGCWKRTSSMTDRASLPHCVSPKKTGHLLTSFLPSCDHPCILSQTAAATSFH